MPPGSPSVMFAQLHELLNNGERRRTSENSVKKPSENPHLWANLLAIRRLIAT